MDDFLKVYKKSIKTVTVSINGGQVGLPITYSMSAAIKYRSGYDETNDYRLAFCIMVLDIISRNKKLINKENDFPILDIEDIKSIEDDELKRIGEEILKSSDYLKELGEEYGHIDDFFKTFFLINKNEFEKFNGTIFKVMGSVKPINVSAFGLGFIKQGSGILEKVNRVSQYSEVFKPSLFWGKNNGRKLLRLNDRMEM